MCTCIKIYTVQWKKTKTELRGMSSEKSISKLSKKKPIFCGALGLYLGGSVKSKCFKNEKLYLYSLDAWDTNALLIKVLD